MSDAMQIARQRIKDHEATISRKEREIEELREMIGDLERFLEFGEDLLGSSAPQASARPVSHQPNGIKPAGQPQSQHQPQPQAQIKEVVAHAAKNSEADDDDEWGSASEKNIEAVLAARKA